jgi:hypothetical protein
MSMRRLLPLLVLALLLAPATAEARGRLGAGISIGKGGVRLSAILGFRTHRHTSCCAVITRPGYWRLEAVTVFQPGHYETIHVPARFETRYDSCGNPFQVLVEPACTRQIWVEGRPVIERQRVWVAPVTEYACGY